MATITPTITNDGNDPYWVQAVWASVTASDTCVAVSTYRWPQWFWRLTGTAAVIHIQGSNDNTDFENITGLDDLSTVRTSARYVRPNVDSGGPVTITLFLSKQVT